MKTNYLSDLEDEEWQQIQERFTFKQSSREESQNIAEGYPKRNFLYSKNRVSMEIFT